MQTFRFHQRLCNQSKCFQVACLTSELFSSVGRVNCVFGNGHCGSTSEVHTRCRRHGSGTGRRGIPSWVRPRGRGRHHLMWRELPASRVLHESWSAPLHGSGLWAGNVLITARVRVQGCTASRVSFSALNRFNLHYVAVKLSDQSIRSRVHLVTNPP